jgi:hypothetical protein
MKLVGRQTSILVTLVGEQTDNKEDNAADKNDAEGGEGTCQSKKTLDGNYIF